MKLQLLAAGFAVLTSACASTSPGDVRDPWEGLNRKSYAFNEAADRAVIGPISDGYRNVTPKPVRTGISNFFQNLNTPAVLANDILQGKPKRAGTTLLRFGMNSIFGLGGFVDVGERAGLEGHTEDFGQTLAVWGVPSGPYTVIPFLGPSTLRDGVGSLVDTIVFDPLTWVEFGASSNLDSNLRITRNALVGISTRAEFAPALDAIREQPEPYTALKRAYLQNRLVEIRDGKIDEETFDDLPDFDDFDDCEDFGECDEIEEVETSDGPTAPEDEPPSK